MTKGNPSERTFQITTNKQTNAQERDERLERKKEKQANKQRALEVIIREMGSY